MHLQMDTSYIVLHLDSSYSLGVSSIAGDAHHQGMAKTWAILFFWPSKQYQDVENAKRGSETNHQCDETSE